MEAAPQFSPTELRSCSPPLATIIPPEAALEEQCLQNIPAHIVAPVVCQASMTVGTSTTTVSTMVTAPSLTFARNTSMSPEIAFENFQRNSPGVLCRRAAVHLSTVTRTTRFVTPEDRSTTARSSQLRRSAAVDAPTLTVEKRLNIDVPNPKYPDYRQREKRRLSFTCNNWDQRHSQSSDQMAEAGFFPVGE